MGGKAKRVVPPLPVSSSVALAATRKEIRMPPFPAVQLVCLWALVTAFAVAVPVLYDAAHYGDAAAAPAPTASSVLRLTEAEIAAASAVEAGQLWLAAPQATAAALGLLLPGPRRRRRALALAATAGNHYAYSRVAGIVFVAVPGWNHNLCFNFIFVCVAGILDVLGFAALLSSAEDDEEEEE